MMILDTSVLSETQKASPDSNVMNFLENLDPTSTYVTTITVAEVLLGISDLREGQRKTELHDAALELFQGVFKNRVLPLDMAAVLRYATHAAEARKRGIEISSSVEMISGIALANSGTIVATRDTLPFEAMGVTAVDPWAFPKK